MEASSINTVAVDKTVRSAMKAWRTPGAAVAVVQDDDVYVQGYGVREVREEDPVTPNTIFAIASMTKAFTTTAMAILVDEGKIAWDDHPRKYLPYFKLCDPAADANVTLRDLVCHRTGMARHDALWCVAGWTTEEIVRRFGLAPPSHSFRATYEYVNVPFLAAGLAVGAASGSTWEDFVRSRILDPLGMTHTHMTRRAIMKLRDRASGHVKHKGKTLPIPRLDYDNSGPAGGINSCALDMSRWLRLHLNGGELDGKRIVSAEQLAETHKPQMVVSWDNPDKHGIDHGTNLLTYCMGWHKCDYRGELIISHGGWLGGFTGNMTLIPRLRTGIVVLTNLAVDGQVQTIANGLRDLFLGLPKRNWSADFNAIRKAVEKEEKEKKAKEPRRKGTKLSRGLDAYIGGYESPVYGTLTVAGKDAGLTLEYGIARYSLEHFHFDTFVGRHANPEQWGDMKVQFTLGPDGEVASVKTLDSWFEAEFTRMKKASP